jgi:hypothetical protein
LRRPEAFCEGANEKKNAESSGTIWDSMGSDGLQWNMVGPDGFSAAMSNVAAVILGPSEAKTPQERGLLEGEAARPDFSHPADAVTDA